MMKKYFLTHPDNNSLTFQTCRNSIMFKYLLLRALAGQLNHAQSWHRPKKKNLLKASNKHFTTKSTKVVSASLLLPWNFYMTTRRKKV